MSIPDQPKAGPKATEQSASAEVVTLKRPFPPAQQPDDLNGSDALRLVRMIAADSDNIVIIKHATERRRQRRITRLQIERCVRQGTITEGPILNARRNWQMNLTRHAAGEQITCVVAIEWASRVLVITAF
jgi:hypothetical protein